MASVLRNKDKGNRFIRYYKSLKHALEGIGYAIKYEHNMIIIFICGFLVVLTGLVFKINKYEWLFCILSIGLVAGCEMVNTAIEALVDLITLEKNPLAKIAKDSAASATLIFSMMALVGAIIIFVPKAIDLLIRM